MSARFPLGHVVASRGALEVMQSLGIHPAVLLAQHQAGQWGELDDQDKQANEDALLEGGRILSAYGTGESRLLVITEASRSSTWILRPGD
jgi:hypothetical protein